MVKSVRLSDNAYNNLKAQKGDGESFSDLVKRLTAAEKKGPIQIFRELATKATKRFEERGITREDVAEEIKAVRNAKREN
jgi:predicted CopG family antitoxin